MSREDERQALVAGGFAAKQPDAASLRRKDATPKRPIYSQEGSERYPSLPAESRPILSVDFRLSPPDYIGPQADGTPPFPGLISYRLTLYESHY
jgi:hypothetical protein